MKSATPNTIAEVTEVTEVTNPLHHAEMVKPPEGAEVSVKPPEVPGAQQSIADKEKETTLTPAVCNEAMDAAEYCCCCPM